VPVTPIIVVGLGGTGTKALLQLKRMIAEGRPGGMKSLPALRLLCFDSDDLVKPAPSSDPGVEMKDLGLDPAAEYLKLEIPGNVGYADLDRAKAWFPRELEYYIPDLATGCKQYRALGRLMFAWNYAKVLRLIEPLRNMVGSSLLKQLAATQLEDPIVFLVASVCGGTGAGIFLDMGFMLTNLWKRKWSRFNTKVCALLALPSVFSDITQGTERIRSNAYASIKELDHYMNKDVYTDADLAFRMDYPYVEHPETLAFAPFDRAFLFDNSNGRVSVSSTQVYEMMARYIYLMVGGELTQDYNSIDNNLNPKVRGTNRLLNKPTCYSSFGYYSLVFPKRTAVQLAAADLALSLVTEELASATDERHIDELADSFLTSNKVLFSNQSPQILHTLSYYTDAAGQRSNIQDVIGSTVANIDLANEPPESYEGIVREYDTRFSNAELALFESDCRREAVSLLRAFRTNLEGEIQRLADPSRKGSVKQVHLFLEELYRELAEDAQGLERLLQQTERQIPGLKSALDTHFLKLRQTAGSKSLFTLINLKRSMGQLLAETRETLESFWLAKRKAVILRHALALHQGDAQAPEEELRSGMLDAVLREREAYRSKMARLEEAKEALAELLRQRRSIPDGEFYKVAFDYNRDVKAVIDEVKERRHGLTDARRRLHRPEELGPDLDGLLTVPPGDTHKRLVALCSALYEPVFDALSLDERIVSLGDLRTQVKTWLNFSRPFIMLDSVDASKYGFSDGHNAARFIAIPHTYVGKPCEQILNRCPVHSTAECDRYAGCLKRTILESLPEGTSVGHMAGRHEIHLLSLYHGFAASSLIHVISDCAAVYRNHMLGSEKIHMLGPVKLYDLKEPLPNKALERLKDLFYVSFACGSIVWSEEKEAFLFRTDADLSLKLPPSVTLGDDIGSILDNYHSPEKARAQAVGDAFLAMEKRLGERCRADGRALGRDVLAFVQSESVPLDDQEKRRIFNLGQGLAQGTITGL
jgi:hypothetical protein